MSKAHMVVVKNKLNICTIETIQTNLNAALKYATILRNQGIHVAVESVELNDFMCLDLSALVYSYHVDTPKELLDQDPSENIRTNLDLDLDPKLPTPNRDSIYYGYYPWER